MNRGKKQVLSEISEGNYVICDSKPDLITPLGAIPKPAGGVRLIHDCSRPAGNSLNDLPFRNVHKLFKILIMTPPLCNKVITWQKWI